MAGSDLTAKQEQALTAFKDGGDVKDVAKAMGITHAGAYSHIQALKKKGFIDADGRLTTKAVIGKVTAPDKPTPSVDLSGDAEAPATAPTATVANNGDLNSEAFDLDKAIAESVAQRRQELATTVAEIEQGIAAHQRSIVALSASRDQIQQAIIALAEVGMPAAA